MPSTYMALYLYLALRSDSLLLSIVAVLYGAEVLRVNLYGSTLEEEVPSGGGGNWVVPNFSLSFVSSCLLLGLAVYLE